MDLVSIIETRAGVRSGKPCFVGTRVTVYDVLEYLASGMTASEIVADFPELTAAHVDPSGGGGYSPVTPSSNSRVASAWPRCRAVSLMRCRTTHLRFLPSPHWHGSSNDAMLRIAASVITARS